MAVGEAKPLLSESVNIRGRDQFGTVDTDIAIAHIIAVNNHNIGLLPGQGEGGEPDET